jgi:hypothetical protein
MHDVKSGVDYKASALACIEEFMSNLASMPRNDVPWLIPSNLDRPQPVFTVSLERDEFEGVPDEVFAMLEEIRVAEFAGIHEESLRYDVDVRTFTLEYPDGDVLLTNIAVYEAACRRLTHLMWAIDKVVVFVKDEDMMLRMAPADPYERRYCHLGD